MRIRPAALIVNQEKILLMKYIFNEQTVYNLPGGNLDENETLETTLIRELWEELQIKIQVNDIICLVETDMPGHKKTTLHCVFDCFIIENSPIVNAEHTTAIAVEWFPIASLNSINLYPNIGNALQSQMGDFSKTYLGKIEQPWF